MEAIAQLPVLGLDGGEGVMVQGVKGKGGWVGVSENRLCITCFSCISFFYSPATFPYSMMLDTHLLCPVS